MTKKQFSAEELAFLEAIHADRNDTPRLIYADWLEKTRNTESLFLKHVQLEQGIGYSGQIIRHFSELSSEHRTQTERALGTDSEYAEFIRLQCQELYIGVVCHPPAYRQLSSNCDRYYDDPEWSSRLDELLVLVQAAYRVDLPQGLPMRPTPERKRVFYFQLSGVPSLWGALQLAASRNALLMLLEEQQTPNKAAAMRRFVIPPLEAFDLIAGKPEH